MNITKAQYKEKYDRAMKALRDIQDACSDDGIKAVRTAKKGIEPYAYTVGKVASLVEWAIREAEL